MSHRTIGNFLTKSSLPYKERIAARASNHRAAVCEWYGGITWDQYNAVRTDNKALKKFINQRNDAARRGIAFELSLWQWWTVWQDSGFWSARGLGQGYCMCRIGDVGPYAVGNVFIAPQIQNLHTQKRHANRELPLGVRRQGSKFLSYRQVAGRKRYLGTFKTADAAHAAYLAAGPTVEFVPMPVREVLKGAAR